MPWFLTEAQIQMCRKFIHFVLQENAYIFFSCDKHLLHTNIIHIKPLEQAKKKTNEIIKTIIINTNSAQCDTETQLFSPPQKFIKY